jgi:TRAP-type C4-dicarboxylate transport system substrate-binding protein
LTLLCRYAAALFVACLAFPVSAETTWDMPTPYPVSNFHTENIEKFASEVAALTGGQLKITVHANGALYRANEIKRAVRGGQAQIGEIIISGAANEDPLFALDTIPFLASSYSEARALWQVSRSKVEERFARQGLKVLFSVPWPPQGIYAKVALNSLADVKGMKIRSYSPTVARMIELMGAQPVTVQAADLSQALATGVVSANITSASTGYDAQSWEQLSYYFDVQAWLPKNVVIVNQQQFDSLDRPNRGALLKAAAAAELRGWKSSEEKTRWYVEQLKTNKMKVLPASAELQKDLLGIGERMTREWLVQAGADGRQVYDAYRQAVKK